MRTLDTFQVGSVLVDMAKSDLFRFRSKCTSVGSLERCRCRHNLDNAQVMIRREVLCRMGLRKEGTRWLV